ncbi:bifunctional 2-polyprenyl-6-hydroxyphenol methylase/3-demethylubiquinol 3-O-methyltransferase UbiG [Achromobacter sp. UMC46]|uniref:class I SAM-dependent methyltransferase n=1 Tax=Achromobacter sp. UMC46 TaxID=1862319 RepID=UPI001C7F2503|nr:class I SAM-dependent methyltransferase [Achromobacter sp. UMC46]MBB1598191.1 hypothetical protein [Achromobacter sp. UMC46]
MQPKINAYLRDKEEMKPVPVSSPLGNPLAFALRCLLDLQLKTIVDFLKPRLSALEGNVLDVGAGNAPWKSYLPAGVQYVGLDVDKADEFNMRPDTDIVYYPGGKFPFDDGIFANALCVEVLEHVPDTETLLAEIYRCLKPGGQLLMTVPWSARRHHIPHDYFRFTPEALAMLLHKQGLENIQISERGNDYAVIFNKILCLGKNLVVPKCKIWLPLTLPMALLILPSAGLFLVAAHVSMRFGLGSHIDPLGYAIAAIKPPLATPQTPIAKEHP